MRAIAACGLAIATLCVSTVARVEAADLSPLYPTPPVYSEPDAQYEFGTGWYLRGDVGYSESTRLQPFGDLPKLTSSTDWTGGIGAGYRWTENFRTDLTLNFDGYQHLSHVASDASCDDNLDALPTPTSVATVIGSGTPTLGTCRASLLKTDVLVGGYFDIGTWAGLTPYVGAGVGFARIDAWSGASYVQSTDGFVSTANTTSLGSSNAHRTLYNFAWSLMGGVAYAVDDHLSLDLGYRYINLGDFREANGKSKTLDAQQVRLGIRYAID